MPQSLRMYQTVSEYPPAPLFVDRDRFTLENLCTRTAQSSRGGHSRRVGKIACLCAPCC